MDRNRLGANTAEAGVGPRDGDMQDSCRISSGNGAQHFSNVVDQRRELRPQAYCLCSGLHQGYMYSVTIKRIGYRPPCRAT